MFRKPIALIFTAALCLSLTGITRAAEQVKIGILAKRGAKTCLEEWSDTGKQLSEATGMDVTIIPLKFEEIEPAVKDGSIDFVLANSAFYVTLNRQYNVQAVASMVNSRQGKALKEFGGVILVKKDSPIQSIADIKGKKFMCVDKSSFGGGQMAWRLMLDQGVDPQKDCAEFLEGKKHDNVVMAVRAGAVDAGTVRSDTLESMVTENKVQLDEFRIINQVQDDFPFVHSTRLYPEWPMAACEKTPDATRQAVADALKGIGTDDAAAKSAKIVGWCDPLDYQPVVECLTAIQFGVFADAKDSDGSVAEVKQ